MKLDGYKIVSETFATNALRKWRNASLHSYRRPISRDILSDKEIETLSGIAKRSLPKRTDALQKTPDINILTKSHNPGVRWSTADSLARLPE